MNVEEVERGLRILTVFDGSPAARAGLKPGDVIIAVDGQSLTGASSEQADDADQGPRRDRGHADRRHRRQARARSARARDASTCRSSSRG